MKKTLDILAPALLLLVFLLPLKNGFTDDGFIHIQYARNIIERGEYSFNPGEVSFGTTSPLWVVELAALGSFFADREVLVTLSRILSWLSGFLAVAGLYFLVSALGGKRLTALLAALVFASDAWFTRWTALSMETSTAVLTVILMGLAAARAHENLRAAAFLGFFMAVASLVRPEVYLAFPVYAVTLLLLRGSMDGRCARTTLVVGVLLVLPWLLFAKLHIGSLLPNTAGAKSGGLVLSPLVFLQKFKPVVQTVGSTQALTVFAIAASLLWLRGRSRLLAPPFRFLILWTVALPVAYVLFDIQILSRYLLLVTPFVCVFGWLALEELFANVPRLSGRAGRVWMTAAAVVMIAVNAGFYFKVVVGPSREFSHDLTHNMKNIAEYIRDHSDEKAVVAAADIGYLAFYSQRRVLDLGGLVEPVTGELRSRYSYEEIIEKGLYLGLAEYPRVDFFIDRDLEANRFTGRELRGYRFDRVLEKTVRNLGIRKPGPYYYTLYRLVPLQ